MTSLGSQPASTEAGQLSDADVLMQTPGMGALLDGHGGCVFRVWAPHAEAAHVVPYVREEGAAPQPGEPVAMASEGGFWAQRIAGMAAGDRYHFVFRHGGHDHERRDARARFTDYDSNACIVVDPAHDWAPFTAPTWDALNLYQVHVAAFTGRLEGGGGFAGVESKLDYIKGLGFTAIQLMPVHEYAGSWGYNPRLLCAIHPAYGTPHDLRRLVDAAHQKGLAVIFDVVLNHGAARMNSLWAYDGWNPDNKGGLYFDGGADTPFGKSFAWWQHEITDMVLDAALMFLDEYNGDGLRFDCVHVMPPDVLQAVTWRLKERFPGKILIAEHTPVTPGVIKKDGFSSTWMHSSYYDMRAFWCERRSLRKLESLLYLHPGFDAPTQCVKYFLGCHDQIGCRKNGGYDPDIQGLHRYVVELFGGRDSWDARAAARMWYAALAAAQGIPMLFMGSEWHHPGWWGIDPDHLLDWRWQGDALGQDMERLVRDANLLRADSPALRHGAFHTVHFDESHCVLAFLRQAEGSEMLVVVNASGSQWENGEYGVHVGGAGGATFRERFNSQAADYGGWSLSGNAGPGVAARDGKIHINLPKWGVLVFEPAA